MASIWTPLLFSRYVRLENYLKWSRNIFRNLRQIWIEFRITNYRFVIDLIDFLVSHFCGIFFVNFNVTIIFVQKNHLSS